MEKSVVFPWSERFKADSAVQGGMGTVFFCRDTVTGLPVVLKTFHKETAKQQHLQLRFMHEVCDWIYLGQHANIVQAKEVVSLGNPAQPYLVLEGIAPPGGEDFGANVSLQHLISTFSRHALSFPRALEITWHIACAMAHAVDRIPGFVHRDLKPANILIDNFGVARLTDFGIARSFDNIDSINDLYSVDLDKVEITDFKPAGSPHYVAPELWHATGLASTASDVYSLGLCLYEMITGQKRAAGGNYAQLRDVHLAQKLRPIPAAVPPQLSELLDRCSALRPEARFSSWSEVLNVVNQTYSSFTGRSLTKPTIDSPQHQATNRIESMLAICDSFIALSLSDPAQDYAKLALQTATQENDALLQVQAQKRFVFLPDENSTEENIDRMNRSIELCLSNDFFELEVECRMLLANVLARSKRIEPALQQLTQAQEVAKLKNFSEFEIDLLGCTANIQALSLDFKAACDSYSSLLDAFRAKGDTQNEIRALGNLAAAQNDLGDVSASISCYQEFADLSLKHGEFASLALAQSGLVSVFEQTGNIESAMQELTKFSLLAEERQDWEQVRWAETTMKRLSLLAT